MSVVYPGHVLTDMGAKLHVPVLHQAVHVQV